ncbi:MAG: Gfo/Idh/MocA family oxidoreductase [bacterium]|nr:Gfo/Idh/MocA family oxidoreductase [bacterium]
MSASRTSRRSTGPLRVGVLGQGRSGLSIHSHWFEQAPRKYRIVAIADLLSDRRRHAAERFACDTYGDYKDLLGRDDLDLVVNSLPSHLHPPVTIEALEAGHNVVCEKPNAWDVAQLDRMIAAAKKARRILAPFQQSRYRALFRKTLAVIDSGILGRIVQVRIAGNGFARRWDWQTLQEFKGGELLNTGPHYVDWAVAFQGFKKPDEIFCVLDRANTFGDAEDFVKVVMKRKGAPLVDLEMSRCDAYPGEMLTVHGTQGGLTGGGGGLRWKYFDPKKAPRQKLIRQSLPNQAYCREDLKFTEKTWKPTKAQANAFGWMSKQFYDGLYKVLRDGEKLEITPQQVRVQMAVMEECHRQARLSKLPAQGWPKGR